MAKPIKTETARHKKAYAFYVKLGKNRTLTQVAKEFKVKPDTAKLWSASFGWGERLKEMDRKAADAIEKKLEKEYFEDKTRMKKMKLKVFAILEKQINAGNITDTSELNTVVKIIKTELGEASSIKQENSKVEQVNPFFGILQDKYSSAPPMLHSKTGKTNEGK